MTEQSQPDPQAKTIGDIIESLPGRVTPAQLRGLNAVVQIRSAGDGGGDWVITASNGQLDVQKGTTESPNLALSAKADVWASMLNRKLDPAWAYMSGQLQVKGDLDLAMRLQSVMLA